jgi:hypothetical protein
MDGFVSSCCQAGRCIGAETCATSSNGTSRSLLGSRKSETPTESLTAAGSADSETVLQIPEACKTQLDSCAEFGNEASRFPSLPCKSKSDCPREHDFGHSLNACIAGACGFCPSCSEQSSDEWAEESDKASSVNTTASLGNKTASKDKMKTRISLGIKASVVIDQLPEPIKLSILGLYTTKELRLAGYATTSLYDDPALFSMALVKPIKNGTLSGNATFGAHLSLPNGFSLSKLVSKGEDGVSSLPRLTETSLTVANKDTLLAMPILVTDKNGTFTGEVITANMWVENGVSFQSGCIISGSSRMGTITQGKDIVANIQGTVSFKKKDFDLSVSVKSGSGLKVGSGDFSFALTWLALRIQRSKKDRLGFQHGRCSRTHAPIPQR